MGSVMGSRRGARLGLALITLTFTAASAQWQLVSLETVKGCSSLAEEALSVQDFQHLASAHDRDLADKLVDCMLDSAFEGKSAQLYDADQLLVNPGAAADAAMGLSNLLMLRENLKPAGLRPWVHERRARCAMKNCFCTCHKILRQHTRTHKLPQLLPALIDFAF